MYNLLEWKRLLSVVPGILLLGFVQLALAGELEDEALFDISPQALDSALLEFSKQADIQLVVAANSLDGIETQGVSGQISGNDALGSLLKDTDLNFNVVGSTVTVTNGHTDEGNEPGKALPASNKTPIAQAKTSAETNPEEILGSVSNDEETEEAFGIEEVIVTARKREESLQDVPISISAMLAVDIEARSMDELQDLANFVPNFSFFNNADRGKGAPQAYIRGVGQNDTSVTNDPGVGIYVDGVYLARLHGLNLDFMDVERIEVLRGPQGTLFGKNTNGGAISIVTAKPGDELSGSAKITVGRFGRIDAQASVNIPLVENKLAVKLAALSSNRDGYGKTLDFLTGEKTGEMGDENSLSGRALVSWKPTEDLQFLFTIDGTRIRESASVYNATDFTVSPLIGLLNMVVDPPISNVFLTGSEFTNFATGGNAYNVDARGASLAIDWDLGGWNIKSITAYRELDLLWDQDADGTPHIILNGMDDIDQDQFSQEIQFTGSTLDDRLNWLAGLYYFNEGVTGKVVMDLLVPLEAFGIAISDSRLTTNDVDSYAAFSQATYLLTDRLSLTGGLRYTYEKKAVTFERHMLSGVISVPYMEADDTWNATSGRAGFEYRWNDDIMTYLSVARGFKAGGLNGNPSSTADFIPYDPEYVWTYEVGLRSDLLDRRLRFNASLFWSEYSDMQVYVSKVDPETAARQSFIGNAAESEIKGFEVDIVTKPTEELTLTAAIGFIDAQYKSLDPDTNLRITEDMEFLNTPKWSYSVAGQYVMPLGGFGDLTARLDYSHKSQVHHDLFNGPLLLQKSYGLLNGRLTFDNAGGDWSIALFVTNLTNERYILGGRDGRVIGYLSKQPGAPREWGLAASYRF